MEEEKYVLTAKALFLMALMETHLIADYDDWKAELAWKLVNIEMEKRGYVSRED